MPEVSIEIAEEHISNDTEEVSDAIPQENTNIEAEEGYHSIAQERTSTEIQEISADSNAQENHFNEKIGETSNIIAQENTSSEIEENLNIAEEDTPIEKEDISDSVIKEMLEVSALHYSISETCSIHKVPRLFHYMTEPSAYRPQAISIGPFHYMDPSLRANEGLKLQYAHSLLALITRNLSPQEEEESATTTGSIQLNSSRALVTLFKEIFASVKKMETKIRGCYFEPIYLDSEEFVKMMVIDSLFIIELFVFAENPLQNNLLLRNRVIKDLLLLENQIPFFVIKYLCDHIMALTTNRLKPWSIVDLIVFFMSCYTKDFVPEGLIDICPHREECEDAKHLLDLLGIILLFPSKESFADPLSHHKIPSAAELNRAGVRFKRGDENQRFVDINFSSEKGIFEIPRTYIYYGTEAILRNLIACEQLYSGRYNMTSYTHLMDSLINSAEDVAVLRKAGILESFLGCDEDVASIFNKLGSEVILTKNSYSVLEKEVYAYYKKRRHIWKATLKREYFNNPWAIISVFAAVLLILLTIISTVFGILQVVLPKK